MRQLALLLPLACTAHVDPPTREPPPTSPAPQASQAVVPPIATCPIDQPRPQALDLSAVSDIGVVSGKTWHVAQEAGVPVLLHLGRDGALARTPILAWTEDIAPETAALRLVHTQKPARWSVVDLHDPDAPVVHPEAPLPGLLPGDHPKAVASDGFRALVSLYRENPRPGGERYVGDTVLLGVATGARLGPRADMTVWTAHCAAAVCYGVATVNADPPTRALVALDETRSRRLAALGQWGCGGLATWRDGQHWLIAWSEEGRIGLAAVDLVGGAPTLGEIRTAPGTCTDVRHLALPDRHGLLTKDGDRLRFTPVSAAPLRSDPPELLPVLAHDQHQLIAAGDGVLVVDYDASSGLQKDRAPAPDGKVEYDHVWRFAGRHLFLRPAPGQWAADPAAPLPHDGEDGRHGRGYTVHLLARPGHAGVLLAGDGLPSEYLPLRRPCP